FPGPGNCRPRLLWQVRQLKSNRIGLYRAIYNQIPMANGSPLADSIDRAGKLAHRRLGRTRVVIITDGGETCGGNPVAAAVKWRTRTKRIEFHVVGLSLTAVAARQMNVLALAGGGRFVHADSYAALRGTLTSFADRRPSEVRGCKSSVVRDVRDNGDGTATD